jgi:pyruvoyl-dependent arginine decarboxylase (PvlArgDC)
MARKGSDYDLAAYATVAERIRLFYERHPLGRIQTELVSRTSNEVIFKALVYRTPEDELPSATGWAAEREGDGEINLVACLENTETSAVGRALANLGFTASRERPSAEEMRKSSRLRHRMTVATGLVPNEPASRPRRVREVESPALAISDDPLQREANDVVDALALLRTAERFGLRAARGRELRTRLIAGTMSVEVRHQWMAILRHWIEKRRSDALTDPYLG